MTDSSRKTDFRTGTSRLIRTWLSLCVVLLVCLFAGSSFAKTSVVIRNFEGPRATQARTWVVKVLDKNGDYDVVSKKKLSGAKAKIDGNPEGYQAVSQELGVAAIIEGVVSHKGVKWKLELNVVDGATGDSLEVLEFKGNFPAGLKKAVNKELLDKLKGPAGKAQVAKAPEPEKKDEPEAKDEAKDEPKDEAKDEEPKDEAKDETKDAEPSGEHPEAFRVTLRGGAMNRKFEYTDDLNGTLRPYDLGAAPFVRLDLEWYPWASFADGIGANIGLVGGYQQAFALSSETSDGGSLDTSSNEFDVGLRWRIPIGEQEVGISARFGQHKFELDDGDRNFIPSVNYSYVRPGLDARFNFGSVFVGLGVGYRVVLDSGEFAKEPWFPDQSVGAVDGRLEFGLAFGGLDLLLGAGVERYFYKLNPDPDNVGVTDDGDAVAGGALDQYLYGYLGVGYRL